MFRIINSGAVFSKEVTFENRRIASWPGITLLWSMGTVSKDLGLLRSLSTKATKFSGLTTPEIQVEKGVYCSLLRF
jgi:hypothetical protein